MRGEAGRSAGGSCILGKERRQHAAFGQNLVQQKQRKTVQKEPEALCNEGAVQSGEHRQRVNSHKGRDKLRFDDLPDGADQHPTEKQSGCAGPVSEEQREYCRGKIDEAGAQNGKKVGDSGQKAEQQRIRQTEQGKEQKRFQSRQRA